MTKRSRDNGMLASIASAGCPADDGIGTEAVVLHPGSGHRELAHLHSHGRSGGVLCVYLFGSVAVGGPRASCDIDVLVLTQRSLSRASGRPWSSSPCGASAGGVRFRRAACRTHTGT